jgi:hypothetical protein
LRFTFEAQISKTRFWPELREQHPELTPTQTKGVNKLYDAGLEGFAGGMSNEKYVNLSGVSRATAYRELTALCEMGWGGGCGISSHQISHHFSTGYRSAQVQLIKMHLHNLHLAALNCRSSL